MRSRLCARGPELASRKIAIRPLLSFSLMRCCGGAGRACVVVLNLARAIQSGIRNPKLLSLGCRDAMELLP